MDNAFDDADSERYMRYSNYFNTYKAWLAPVAGGRLCLFVCGAEDQGGSYGIKINGNQKKIWK